jgi:aryl-alcohol dehydrogenase-like predicted oxidoreductase
VAYRERNGIGFIPFSPLRGGVLPGVTAIGRSFSLRTVKEPSGFPLI